ncbi:hypothetical protein AB4254_10920 [Vibrio breoganii]
MSTNTKNRVFAVVAYNIKAQVTHATSLTAEIGHNITYVSLKGIIKNCFADEATTEVQIHIDKRTSFMIGKDQLENVEPLLKQFSELINTTPMFAPRDLRT